MNIDDISFIDWLLAHIPNLEIVRHCLSELPPPIEVVVGLLVH